MKTKIQFHSARLFALALTLAAGGVWATDYYWKGNDSTNWFTADNWQVLDGENLVDATDYPHADWGADKAIFNTSATLQLGDTWANVGALEIGENVRLTISGKGIRGRPNSVTTANQLNSNGMKITGSGTLRLEGTTLIAGYVSDSSNAESSIAATLTLEIVEGTENTLQLAGGRSYARWVVNAPLTGSGNLKVLGTNGSINNYYAQFNGSLENFKGTLTYENTSMKGRFLSTDTDLSKAGFTLNNSSTFFPATPSTLFKFGALDGYITGSEDNKRAALEIGARNEDSAVRGKWYQYGSNHGYCNAVRWIAKSATLTWSVEESYEIVLAGGGAIDITNDCISTTFSISTGADTSYLHNKSKHSDAEIDFLEAGGYLVLKNEALDATVISRIKDVDDTAVFGITNAVNVTADLSGKTSALSGKKFGKKGAGTLTVTGLTTFGAVTIADGPLVLPIGSTIASATIADDAELQFAGDPTWADGTEVTLATFTTVPDAATLAKIKITGLGGRQSYVFDTSDGTLKATISSTTLVWNGANDTDWSASDAWLANGSAATFAANDSVEFTDAAFTFAGATELTVKVDNDVAPASVTFAAGKGNTYILDGTGLATAPAATLASGTLTLKNDVLAAPLTTSAGATLNVDAGENTVCFGYITSPNTDDNSKRINVLSGTAVLTNGFNNSGYNSHNVAENATLHFKDVGIGSSSGGNYITMRGKGTVVIDNMTLDNSKGYSAFGGTRSTDTRFEGTVRLLAGGELKCSGNSSQENLGGGTFRFEGGTVTGGSNSSQSYSPAIVVADGTSSIWTEGTTAVTLTGAISGGGELAMSTGARDFTLSGDNSGFTGTLTHISTTAAKSASVFKFNNVNSGSASATWNLNSTAQYETDGAYSYNIAFAANDTPIAFGALNVPNAATAINVANEGVTVEVGGKANGASTINGTFTGSATTLKKSGETSSLALGSTFSMPSGSTINVAEGKLATEQMSFTGVNFTFADGTSMAITLDDASSTDDVEILRTTGTITLNGSQTVEILNEEYSTDGSWKLKKVVDSEDANCNILYATYVNAGGVVVEDITVPSSWLEEYDLSDKTEAELAADRTDGNGYSYFACYALGLDPTDETSVPVINSTTTNDGKFNLTLAGIDVPEGVTLTVQLQGSSDGSTFTDIDGKTATAVGTAEGTETSGAITFDPTTDMGENNVKYLKMGVSIGATATP